MPAQKGELVYEGKGKKVYGVSGESNLLWLEFKDSLTAFNAKKKGSFAEKGAINRDIASLIFRYLKNKDVDSHWVRDVGRNEMICEKLTMIPLEVVVRNNVAGSLAKKFNSDEGEELPNPLVEFYYKKDEWNDPFINDEQALYLKAVQHQAELDELKKHALRINEHLKKMFADVGIRLVDFKLEFGRAVRGEFRLGDEITPDSCRLWDLKTGHKLDKDRFRRDLGGVDDGYKEVLNRLRRLGGVS